MNETIQTIKARFSCRKFSDRPVEDAVLKELVEAGKYAANGKNAQPWHFTVIRTPEGRDLLREAAGKNPPPDFPLGKPMPGVPEKTITWPFQSDFCGAPAVILISGDPNVPWPEIGPVLAAANVMLAATSLGLATLWSSLYTKDLFRDEAAALRSRFLPEGYVMRAALFVGYPEKLPAKRPPRREDVETWL